MAKYSRSVVPKNVGKRIKAIRRSKKIRREDFAIEAGISVIYLAYIEQGRRSPSLKTLDKIARALRVSVREFFD